MQEFIKKIKRFIQKLLFNLKSPQKKIEQKIRELKDDCKDTLQGQAELSSIIISTKKSIADKKQTAIDCGKNAMIYLQQAKDGKISQQEADSLAKRELLKKDKIIKDSANLSARLREYEEFDKKIENRISCIQEQISDWENQLLSIKARHKIASASIEMNKKLSEAGANSTDNLLSDMRTKLESQEAIAATYDDMLYLQDDIDKQINEALGNSYSPEMQNSLTELKNEIQAETEELPKKEENSRVIDL